MAANGTISGTQAREIISFPREFYEPERIAQPLSSDDAKRLLSAPGAITIKGARDRAILAVILGCGLNLYECAQLHVADISKGGTVSAVDSGENRRVVPLPDWVKATIDAYMKMSGVSNGVLFRRSLRGDHLQNDPISYVSIGAVVREYADQIGLLVNSRDLRQTAVALSAQETADYKARIADLERETVSLRRALALKSNLPHDKLREVVVQYGERP